MRCSFDSRWKIEYLIIFLRVLLITARPIYGLINIDLITMVPRLNAG